MKRNADRNQIVFVLSQYAVGGAEKQLANLIRHRPPNARNMKITTVTFLPTASTEVEGMFEAARAVNVLVNRRDRTFPGFFLELMRVLRRVNPVIVSTILDSSVGAWGRLAAVLAGVPTIVHSDRLLNAEGTRAHYLLRPFLDRRTARFLPNAKAIAERLMEDGVPGSKIVVMPNGVDLKLFDPEAAVSSRSTWELPSDATILGYLGRFAPQKRVDLLLQALLKLPPQERPDYVILGGDGPTMPLARS
ncbi:MAG: glycosyltransferase, partial [Trueperaceae bacterium]